MYLLYLVWLNSDGFLDTFKLLPHYNIKSAKHVAKIMTVAKKI